MDSSKQLQQRSPLVPVSWTKPAIVPRLDDTVLEAVSLSAPSLAFFSNNLFLCYRERDDSVWIAMSSNGKDWDIGTYKILKGLASGFLSYVNRVDNSLYTIYRPSIASFSSYMWVAYTNKSDNSIGLCKTADPTPPMKLGSTWTALTNVSVPTTPASGPSIATFNSKLYLAYRDTDSNMYIGYYDGSSWSSFVAVTDSNSLNYTSMDGPTLLAVTTGNLPSRLWISFRTINTNYFGYASFSGSSITGWTMNTAMNPTANNAEMPVVALFSDNLYAGFQGEDQKVNFGCSTNGGSSWGDWGTLDNLTVAAPALAKKDSVLTLAFSAFSLETNKRFLMTTYHDFATDSNGKEE